MTRTTLNALRHPIQLQARSTTQDAFGQELVSWTTTATCWAQIEPALGGESVAGGAVVSTVTHQITVRYRPSGIAPRMRVLYGSRIFEIASVIDVDERHEWMQLACVEGQSQG